MRDEEYLIFHSLLYIFILSALRNYISGLYSQTSLIWSRNLDCNLESWAGHWRASYQENDCNFKCMSVWANTSNLDVIRIVQWALHKTDTTTEWLAKQQLTHQIEKSARLGHDQWIIIVDIAVSSSGKNCQGKSEVNKAGAGRNGRGDKARDWPYQPTTIIIWNSSLYFVKFQPTL